MTTTIEEKFLEELDLFRQELQEALGDLWPGCQVVDVETTTTLRPGMMRTNPGPLFRSFLRDDEGELWAQYGTDITIRHPESSLDIHCAYDPEKGAAMTLRGLLAASNRDVQRSLPAVSFLRGKTSWRPTSSDYDRAYKQIQEGEDPDRVRRTFLLQFDASSNAFNNAMYYRRGKKRPT